MKLALQLLPASMFLACALVAADPKPTPSGKTIAVSEKDQFALKEAAYKAQIEALQREVQILRIMAQQDQQRGVNQAFADMFKAAGVTPETHDYDPKLGALVPKKPDEKAAK